MTNHGNLSNRVKKAKNTKVEMVIEDQMAKVAGSKSSYKVTVHRNKAEMSFTCVEGTGQYCRGNSFGTICYHSMRFAIELAKSKGYEMAFCANEAHARLRARIGGKAYKLSNNHRTGEVWVVVEGKRPELQEWQKAQVRHLDEAIRVQEQIVLEKGWSLLAKKSLAALIESRNNITSEVVYRE